jgi:hypothetical protein
LFAAKKNWSGLSVHGSDKAFLPFGVQAELQASENGHATVTIKEPYTM